MNNIVLLTHGEFSKGIAQSCRFIAGNIDNLIPLSISLNETIEDIIEMLESADLSFENREAKIIITDIPGGSTTQAALKYLEKHPEYHLVSGLNLGLLLELTTADLSGDKKSDTEVLQRIVHDAKNTMMVIDQVQTICGSDLSGEL